MLHIHVKEVCVVYFISMLKRYVWYASYPCYRGMCGILHIHVIEVCVVCVIPML